MAPQSIEAINESASRTASNVSSTSSSLWHRISDWASENKTIVYTAAGVTFVATSAGILYYFSASSANSKGDHGARKSKNSKRKAKKEAEGVETRADQSKKQPSVELEEELPNVDESTVASLSDQVGSMILALTRMLTVSGTKGPCSEAKGGRQ